MPIPSSPAGARAYELDRAHVFHSWSAQDLIDPMVIDHSDGSYIYDADGKGYLDFSGQLIYTNIGHQHPKVTAAIAEQAQKLCTIAPSYATEAKSEAARLVAEHAPEGMKKVFFTNGGAEAVENAIRMARLHTGRYKIASQFRGYHGATATAINITGDPRRWPNDYGNSGAVHFFGPFLYRSAFHATTPEEECERALEHLESMIMFEGPELFAAIILETIAGTSGVMPPPPGYLKGVREICDRYGILLILDEVMVGFGRTGKWFALDHYDVTPDLITFAKGVNSGYVPLGGVIIGDHVTASFGTKPYPGGLTYSGHPLACAAAVATMNVMVEENMVEQAAKTGHDILGPGLHRLALKHPSIGDVRGMGAFWGLDLVADRETKKPLAPYGGTSDAIKATMAACTQAGLMVFNQFNRIHLAPPLNVSADDVHKALGILDVALDQADAATEAGKSAA